MGGLRRAALNRLGPARLAPPGPWTTDSLEATVINDTVPHPGGALLLEDDPCAWAARRMAEAALGIPERRTEAELVEAIEEDERRQGRAMSPRERRCFALGFFSPSYDVVGCLVAGLDGGLAQARVVGRGLPIKDDREPGEGGP